MLAVLFSNVMVAIIVLLFFGVTIFIHELGHYLVALWCGLEIKAFSIGFGPAIWKYEKNGIVYKIGCIPLGGYVALPQLDPTGMEKVQGKTESGDEDEAGSGDAPPAKVAPWRKILVAFAGAAGNVLLAFIIAWLVYWIGMPATTANRDAVVGYVSSSAPIYEAGVRAGDRIIAVNGTSVASWSQFVQEVSMYDEVVLDVKSGETGDTFSVNVPTEPWQYGVHMVAGIDAPDDVFVAEVDEGLSAAAAGVLPGDQIIEFADIEVMSRGHLIALVQQTQGETVAMDVRRSADGEEDLVTLSVTPEYDAANDMARIGIRFQLPSESLDTSVRVHPKPMTQVSHHASAIFRFLHRLVTPSTSARATRMVGGPVAIITYYFGMVQASFMLAVWFTGFLNINLAIINLLPIPILDGGHIVFALWEWIFRKPVPAKVVNILVNFFFVVLVGVFLLLSFRDVGRTALGRYLQGLFTQQQEELQEEDASGLETNLVVEPE